MQVGQTVAVFAMTAPNPEGEDGPSLELRLFNSNEDDRKGWGYHIWPDGRERTLSGKKPVRNALAPAQACRDKRPGCGQVAAFRARRGFPASVLSGRGAPQSRHSRHPFPGGFRRFPSG